jgi:hypothetical protein
MKAAGLKNFFRKINLVYLILVIVVLSVLVVRVALPGIVKNYVNKQLNQLPGYTGHVDDIDIHLIRGAYVIEGLVLRKRTDPPKYPFLKIRHADLSIEWKSLFKGRLVSEVIANEPSINILSTEDIDKEPSKESWDQTVKALMPITINRLQINRGSFAYLDFQKKPNVNLHIDDMQLTALNLANVQKTNDPLPSDVTLTGTTIGKGRLKSHMRVNALKEIPDFDLGMSLTGVNLLALNSVLEANVKIDIERGGLDVFSQLKMTDGQVKGYVKPFIKNLKVLNVKKDIKKKGGVLRVVKEAVVGLFTKVVKNPKTKKIATIVPIEGNIKDPKTSGWKAFVGFLKNAFVQAFKESITNEAKVQQGS